MCLPSIGTCSYVCVPIPTPTHAHNLKVIKINLFKKSLKYPVRLGFILVEHMLSMCETLGSNILPCQLRHTRMPTFQPILFPVCGSKTQPYSTCLCLPRTEGTCHHPSSLLLWLIMPLFLVFDFVRTGLSKMWAFFLCLVFFSLNTPFHVPRALR